MANRLRILAPRLAYIGGSGNPIFAAASEGPRSFATATTGPKEADVKVPLSLYGGTGNYASALFISASKAKVLDKVESELANIVQASKKSTVFTQFMKDLSVPAETKVKAVQEIFSEAGFSDVTKNFLVCLAPPDLAPSSPLPAHNEACVWTAASRRPFLTLSAVLAVNGRLRYLERIAQRYTDLTMAHRGEVKAIVTSVVPLGPAEEKDLKETLQYILGEGKTVKLEQKIDLSILGGLVVQYGEKLFDFSIKRRAKEMEKFLRDPANASIF
ncbi:hypothetical protein QJS04_geneDACA016382 [Acorus gramineus]|uniref:ATP synthase subunit O, mitochondrial n=1 Tax=Acorus gramineus TaxID=55184 RepID=A0AAV9AT52_ACOGR|nr:hypothetical protein QJS04_geneDACA016382 [Acorus gramineus]